MNKGDVVQFIETHKWCGCLGVITEVKEGKHPRKYMIGVAIPDKGTAYIFDDGTGIEKVGKAVLVEADCE